MIRAALLMVATTTSGPSFAVHGWEATLILCGVLAAALAAVYKLVKPITHMAVLIVAAWPQIKKALPFVAQLPDVMPALLKLAAVSDALLALQGDVNDLKTRTARIESKLEDALGGGRAEPRDGP